MPLSDTLRDIDRLFRSAADAAAEHAGPTAGPPHRRGPLRNLAAVAALTTAATVHAQTVQAIYVDDDAPPGGDGGSWATAFSDLTLALNRARTLPEEFRNLRIAGGVYRPQAGERWTAFTLTSGMTLMGGFAGIGQPDPDAHDPAAFVTVLTADVLGDDGEGFTHRNDNAMKVVAIGPADGAALIDLTIQGGQGSWVGGISCGQDFRGTLTLVNCRLVDNTGPAIFATDQCWVYMRDCRVEGNRTGYSVIRVPRLEMLRCVVQGNTLGGNGWVNPLLFYVERGLTLRQCLIVGAPTPLLTYDDPRPLIGGAGSVIARGCTLVTSGANQTMMDGGLDAVLVGSIVTCLSGQPARISEYPVNSLAVTRCCLNIDDKQIENHASTAVVGQRVIFASPRLVAPLGPDRLAETYLDNDFRLAPFSPAIDFSNTAWLPSDYADFDGDMDYREMLTIDLAGAPRIHDDPGTPNLGEGVSQALDLGPYEFQGTSCRADYDASGVVGIGDVFVFLHDWFIVSPDADFNRSGVTDLGDLFDFLAAYFAGCP